MTRTLLAAATAWLLAAAPALALDLSGAYDLYGRSPGVPATAPADYGGTLRLTATGEDTYLVDMALGMDEEELLGKAVLRTIAGRRVLAATITENDAPELVLYEVTVEGRMVTLKGLWTGPRLGSQSATKI